MSWDGVMGLPALSRRKPASSDNGIDLDFGMLCGGAGAGLRCLVCVRAVRGRTVCWLLVLGKACIAVAFELWLGIALIKTD